MAVFCALCAQPGINLPEDWREYENRGFMMDRNFQAEHMKMRSPENDVPVSKGAEFMQSTCHDHHAVDNVNKHDGHLKSTGIGHPLISYDVMCQWSIHMMERVNSSNYLKLPDNLELKLAIGLFHIHGHQDTCMARYSPSVIKGSQQIDGKTIEMLWAPLNEITRSTRGMSFTSLGGHR
ncbi:hypothetical protein V8E53_002607 [Lactarius tabidus]